MVFSSHIFLYYFLPLLLLIYYNLPYRSRNLFLTVANYAFYGWWNPWFLLLMFFSTVVNYYCGKIITAPRATDRRRKWTLGLCIAVNLALLGFFKYFMFLAETCGAVGVCFGMPTAPILRVTLPIGISFYTFQAISYVVDLYRRDAEPAQSLVDYACFISLFPHSVAGPIIRYHTIATQFRSREHAWSRFSSGVALFTLGLAKKILLANPMGEAADAVFAASGPLPLDAWFGAVAYAFQIYFDFCGYSDMAVGLARLLGFELMKNFNAPYLADSITDVWRRWHISLSTFLRDYLYVPLGGNRKGPARTYANLATVMLLGGLWHGANWTFLAWGGYHGALLAFERWRGKTSVYERLPRPARIAITFVLMLFSWVLFRAESLPAAGQYFASMLGLTRPHSSGLLLAAEIYTPRSLLLMAICGLLVIQPIQAHEWVNKPMTHLRAAGLLTMFVMALAVMSTQSFNPFLYFQFQECLAVIGRLRSSEFFITAGFLGVLCGVPLAQIALELGRGQHVQFTDVFRYPPTLANLRRYERALENQSWVRQEVRPAVQRALFVGLKDTGSKGLLGTDGWIFYRPGVRYLVEGDRPDAPDLASLSIDLTGPAKAVLPATWAARVQQLVPEIKFDLVAPGRPASRRQAALEAIVEYRRQLKDRGIELLVMPVPEKSSVYPERLARRADVHEFRSPSEALLDDLRREGVETIDLFALFRRSHTGTAGEATGSASYLATDTHWTPEGARLAAESVAERIRQRGWLPERQRKYKATAVQVRRHGDVVEMLQVPGIDRWFPAEEVACWQVTDKIVGLLTPRAGDREGTFANTHLKDTPLEPTVLLLGDSFSRIYQLPEPKSLGEIAGRSAPEDSDRAGQAKSTRRLLPGSAGLPSLLAQALQSPVDYILSDGGAATEVRQRLSVNSEILENKKVIVWEFTERDVGLGRQGWRAVLLPPKL